MPWLNRTALKDYRGVNWIHPLKQRSVELLVDKVKQVPGIKVVIIFGSVTEERCTPFSDIDVMIVGRPNKGYFIPPQGDIYDIIYADSVPANASLWEEIKRDGVIVYET